jgi:hypothetical protein
MKTIFSLMILALVFTSCGSDDPEPVTKKTDPAIQPYYDGFLQDAALYDVEIKETVILQFGDCDCLKDGVWYVKFDESSVNLEFYTYHALGHALLKKEDVETPSIMNLDFVNEYPLKRSQAIEDLFTL